MNEGSTRYPKALRLRTRRQFQRIRLGAMRYVGQHIIIETCPNYLSILRLGITASRRYGKAVQRNRFKRIAREAFRLCYRQLQIGMDINIKPRSAAIRASTPDIMAELLHFLALR